MVDGRLVATEPEPAPVADASDGVYGVADLLDVVRVPPHDWQKRPREASSKVRRDHRSSRHLMISIEQAGRKDQSFSGHNKNKKRYFFTVPVDETSTCAQRLLFSALTGLSLFINGLFWTYFAETIGHEGPLISPLFTYIKVFKAFLKLDELEVCNSPPFSHLLRVYF